ncbi:MAG: hypothetical protein VYC34_07885, partial [Planctomycetota bacterium]|nr:hypothetical protein [Planctomycetota bacterium]
EQQISLYHDADGVLAWRTEREALSDFSRNRRREFYTVQLVELPETLTVGRYQLKVTVRDKTTDAISEATVPIEIVADPSLTRAGEE